ncbi:ATPase, partial [Methylobacterium mesophilicum]
DADPGAAVRGGREAGPDSPHGAALEQVHRRLLRRPLEAGDPFQSDGQTGAQPAKPLWQQGGA